MRTTVEIRDEHRARLLELAGRRREKGFSRLVDEAVALYLEQQERQEGARRRALSLRGSLDDEESLELRRRALAIREEWR